MGEWGIEFTAPTINLDTLRARKDKVISNLTTGLAGLAKRRNVKVIPAKGTFLSSTKLKLERTDTHRV